MLTRKHAILAAAALAATPMFGKAAVVTFAYEPGQITVNGVVTALGGTASAPTLTVPEGAIIDIGATVDVTGNPNAAAGDAYYTAKPTFAVANLGIQQFGFGFNTSSSNVAAFDPTVDGSGGIVINPNFGTVSSGGSLTGTNITGSSVSGGNLPTNLKASTAAGAAALAYGAGTAADIFNGLQIDAGSTNGTAVITPTTLLSSNGYIVYNSGGTSSTSVPVYKAVITTAADTVTSLPALTIIVGTGGSSSTSSSTSSGHSIVTLASSVAALGGNYGSQLGATLNMVGSHGSYLPAFTGLISPAQTTGYAAASGFNPLTDTEVYALQFNVSTGTPTAQQIADVVSDINTSGGGTNNVSASVITGVYASLFPTYDILLTSTSGFTPGAGGVADLGIDFSQDTDAATPGLVVTEVAAVPEPATAAGAVLGAAGLLLGRRKKQLASA